MRIVFPWIAATSNCGSFTLVLNIFGVAVIFGVYAFAGFCGVLYADADYLLWSPMMFLLVCDDFAMFGGFLLWVWGLSFAGFYNVLMMMLISDLVLHADLLLVLHAVLLVWFGHC